MAYLFATVARARRQLPVGYVQLGRAADGILLPLRSRSIPPNASRVGAVLITYLECLAPSTSLSRLMRSGVKFALRKLARSRLSPLRVIRSPTFSQSRSTGQFSLKAVLQ